MSQMQTDFAKDTYVPAAPKSKLKPKRPSKRRPRPKRRSTK